MDAILRAAAIYFAVWLFMRIAGRRTLSEITPFDFVLLLIIGEATQQALLGDDFSVTNAFTVVLTLVGIDISLGWLKGRSKIIEKVLEGLPLVVIEDGRLMKDRMQQGKVDEHDILEAARRLRGLERLDQIKYAVLERSGGITIIAK